MARRWSVPFISMLAAIIALVLVAPQSDPAEGAIPNKAGVYSACLTKKTGAILFVNYPKKQCSSGQRLIRWNVKGQTGAQGAQGPAGPAGTAGITKINLTRIRVDKASTGDPGESGFVIASCPAGRATGGGFSTSASDVRITDSRPDDKTAGWAVLWERLATGTTTVSVHVICMTTDPSTVIATARKAKKRRKAQGRDGRRPEKPGADAALAA